MNHLASSFSLGEGELGKNFVSGWCRSECDYMIQIKIAISVWPFLSLDQPAGRSASQHSLLIGEGEFHSFDSDNYLMNGNKAKELS